MTLYQRFPSAMPIRFNYTIRESENATQMRPFNNIASVYEEVAAKVGVGIIDDPLEAFNRIMKEKEKKKDERRSPDRRRRSKDRHVRGNFRISPYNNRTKDHGYHDKRGRSRERDNDRRWNRFGKGIEKERERERDRDRERERERDREKEQAFRIRRSKSIDRSSRSRSHSAPNKRYRSPQTAKGHSTQEKSLHHRYHPNFKVDEQQEDGFERHKRDSGRSLATHSKSLDSRSGNRHQTNHDENNMELRRSYNINDENSEPPPPGFEMQCSRNPFHTNNASASPADIKDRILRNNTPDLYEKCVSQDMEENMLYNTSSKTEKKSRSRSAMRSRSRSRSSVRASEKRRKINRSTTPKGKPSDGIPKRGKDNTLKNKTHTHSNRKSEDYYGKKDKETIDHESKRCSMTPPRQRDNLSDHQQTSSETDQKDKQELKKSDKKLKDRKKKRREKSERKKVKKEKKSKKERHRKSEEKDTNSKIDEKNEDNTSTNIIDKEKEPPQKEFGTQNEEKYHTSTENDLSTNCTPKTKQNGSTLAQSEITPKNKQPTTEYEEKTPTSSDIKCFDAVLDIHEYETDFDDNSFKMQDDNNKLLPEASKWELEDQACTATQLSENLLKADGGMTQNHTDNKVTNDVIVRAEKAIFARAINAIRPLEIRTKSVSKERSTKCYSDEHESIRNIQITLPVNINKDRSIEVKTETNEKKKSIKDRLGSKVSQPMYSQLADSRRESDQTLKSSDRNIEGERDRRKKDNSKKNENDTTYRHGRDRDRSHEQDKTREKDRERGKDQERSRHPEKDNAEKNREAYFDKNRERMRDRYGLDLESDRSNILYGKNRDRRISKADKTHRDYENALRKRHITNSPIVVQKKKSPSFSYSDTDDDDRKRKHYKNDKKPRKRSESLDSESCKKSNKKKNKSDKKKKKKTKK